MIVEPAFTDRRDQRIGRDVVEAAEGRRIEIDRMVGVAAGGGAQDARRGLGERERITRTLY